MKLSHTVLASLLIIVTQMVGTAAATEPGTPVIDRSRASIELPVSTPLDHQNRAINPKEAPDRLASAVDTCLDLSYAGSPAFVWPLPSNSGIVEYAMRFDGDGAQVLTSVEIPIYNNGDGEFGDNNLHLAIYEDDGDGLPGTLIAADTILAGTYSSYPASTLFDLESLNLVVNDTFHVGIATDAAPGMGENELIISDDGSGGLGRSSLYAFGAWMTLPDAFGTDESFLMNVVLCPIVDMSDTAGMGITISGPGAGPGNTILCGQTIDFNIHLRNNTGNDLLHLANGFHLYSLNAISWATPTFSVDPAMSTVFPQTNTFTYSLDGAGADSVSLDYLTVVGGLPPDWEGTVATLATTFSCADTGMVACIDSCWTPGSGPWTWWPNGGSPMPPSWTGPHCFMVAPDSLFGIEIVFEHDVQASETIHFANNIPPNNPVHIQFKPWVHFLPESVPIKVLHDGDSSEYTFHVSDISGNWMMPLDTHEIVFNDTVMWQLDEGTHEYRVDLGVDSTTITRLREYITQDKPFADGGCWAVPQLSLFDPSLELYRIDTHFPPYDPIFRVYYTDARFFRPNVTYEYDFSVSADISQEFNLNGTMDIDVTSLYCMKLHGRSILCGDINLSARELGPDLGQIPRMATLDFPSLFEIDPIRLYKGYMVKIKAGKLLNIEAGGSIKLRDASLEHDTYLRLPCDPYVFGVAITPHLDVGVKAYGKLELLGGAASAKARIWAETEFSIPCSLKVAPDFSFDISADPCFFLDLKYRATVKAWKLSYTYQGSYTLIDTCLSVHLPSGETRDQGRIPMTTSVADSRYYGPPALASHGSASMSVFVNSQSPGDEQIYYSKLDTTSGWAWTAPAKMTTSNDAKFHPDITNLGDTAFVAIWVESVGATEPDSTVYDSGLSLDQLYDVNKTNEIFVNTYHTGSGSWGTPQKLTNDGYADGGPAIAASSNHHLCAVWSYNDDASSYDPMNQKIRFAYYNGISWWHAVLPNQSGYNVQPSVTFDRNDNAVIVWVHDGSPVDGASDASSRELLQTTIPPTGTPTGTNLVVTTARGPLNPSVAIGMDSTVAVAYEFYGLHDSAGVLLDSVVFGDNIQVAVSLGDLATPSQWQVDTVGFSDSLSFGSMPKLLAHDNLLLLTYVGYEHDVSVLPDGNLRYTELNLMSPAPTWKTPAIYADEDTVDTYLGDLTIDPTGMARIQYQLDSAATNNYPSGYNKIHELTLVPNVDCCEGMRGNIDGGEFEVPPDITDLVYMVDWMFILGDEPPCPEEADVDASGEIDIGDLVFVVDFMFNGGIEPLPCDDKAGMDKETRRDGLGIMIESVIEPGATTIYLKSPVDLRGIQLELKSESEVSPANLIGDRIDMPFGQRGGIAKLGLLDLDGDEIIAAGDYPIVKLDGECRIVSAKVADRRARPIVPSIRASSGPVELPTTYQLYPNYPNPFNPNTTIRFALPEETDVRLTLFNLLGQIVAPLINEHLAAGQHQVDWDGRNQFGRAVASGVYFYRLDTQRFSQTRKMVLLK